MKTQSLNKAMTVNEYSQVTRDVKVTVRPVYLRDESDPEEFFYAWAYYIELENQGKEVVQLVNRYWNITDATGHVQEVRGPGVVGKQPVLKPGERFEYVSGTHLPTTSGIMSGFYEMHVLEEQALNPMFHLTIPAFSLDSDEQKKRPN